MDKDKVAEIAASLALSKAWPSPCYIASGNSSSVFRVLHPTLGPVALKVYDPAFFSGENALIEAKRVALQLELRAHGNPHLIEVWEAEEIKTFGTWYIIMELCDWPTLDKRISDVPNEAVIPLIQQLAKAVAFLDERSLVHRDIKPENIGVSDDFSQLKLLDLGVLRSIAPDEGNGTDVGEKKRFIATAQYSPPEYLAREEAGGFEGFVALNVYQLGGVLHDLIMKRPLFADEARTMNRYILYKAITSSIPRIINPNIPARLSSLCQAALAKDPIRRSASVRVSDFLSAIDTADALRRRLTSARATVSSDSRPSYLVWESRIRAWIATAARLEKETLGPYTLAKIETDQGIDWNLTFRVSGKSVRFHLRAPDLEQCLHISMSITQPVPLEITVLAIYNSGPSIEEDAIPASLSEHILYLIDLTSEPVDETSAEETHR